MSPGLLEDVPSWVGRISRGRSDDWIDRMSHIYTVGLLIAFAVVVSSGQYVGDPIHCWTPAEFTKDPISGMELYAKLYCWVKNTYYIPMTQTIPNDIQVRQDAEIAYYQWVPLILLFQAFLFKLPNVIWRMVNGASGLNLDRICKLSDDTQCGSPDERKETVENIAFFIDRWTAMHREYKSNAFTRLKAKLSRVFCIFCNKRQGTFLTALYLSIKGLYVGNIILQFFILNAFMATNYNVYGFEYLDSLVRGIQMRENPRFPRVTLCDFEIRQLQNVQKWTVQCVLPINLFNEKIFIFLWFWFFLIAALSVCNFIKWLFLIISKRNNYKFVKKFLTITNRIKTPSDKEMCHRFAENYLRDDGCFVVRMVGLNSTQIVVTDLLEELWTTYTNQNKNHDD